MDIKLDLSEEAISRMVSDSIMKAAIGKALNDGVSKAINGGTSYQPSPFQKAIDEAVGNMVRTAVLSDGPIKTAISQAVAEALKLAIEKGTVKTLAEKFAESIRIKSSYD